MDHIIITIARYYGSGGRAIGKDLARELGIGFYDRQILQLASDDSGINEALFAQADERLQGTRLFRIMRKSYDGTVIPPESKDFLSNQNLFNYQAKVIRALAEEESCVIIGRCANYVLRDYPNVVNVFIYASPEHCLEMAKKRGAGGGRDTEKFIAETNRYRGDYYKYYTGREWDDVLGYDLCLNSGRLGFAGTCKVIRDYVRDRFPGWNPGE